MLRNARLFWLRKVWCVLWAGPFTETGCSVHLIFLPSANEVCDGYVFTPVYHSLHGWEGVQAQGGVCLGGVSRPRPGRGCIPACTEADTPPPRLLLRTVRIYDHTCWRMVHGDCYITFILYLHRTLVYPSPWNSACYVMITVDRGSTSTILVFVNFSPTHIQYEAYEELNETSQLFTLLILLMIFLISFKHKISKTKHELTLCFIRHFWLFNLSVTSAFWTCSFKSLHFT